MFGPNFYNTLWMAACYREAQAFRRDTADVQQTQLRILQRILHDNRQTWFGEQRSFSSIASVEEFQNAVPISTFDDYRAPIERIARGEPQILTAERVELLEPTGGSSRGEKLIPYAASLRTAFQRAISVWIWDLYSRRPAVRRGTAYWSISPLASLPRKSSGGIPIGFDEDAAYLGRFERALVERTMSAPGALALAPNVETCRFATLFFLLRDPRLSLISVWSPTFLTELLKSLYERRDELCRAVELGRIDDMPSAAPPSFMGSRRFEPQPARAAVLRRLLNESQAIGDCIREIWPRLSLVSCWSDGPSSAYANDLRDSLNGIELQPKGLLATEGFVSVPLVDQAAPALAIRSHFLEFRPVSPSTRADVKIVLAHELERGAHYEVLITTQGGLYRYQLHDQIEVIGFLRETPLVRFVGKTDATSDLVGEKLNAAHAQSVLQAAFSELGVAPRFAQLAADARQSRYRIRVLCSELNASPTMAERLCQLVDAGLSSNPAYRYARELTQLRQPVVELMEATDASAAIANELETRTAHGQRLGDVKASTFG